MEMEMLEQLHRISSDNIKNLGVKIKYNEHIMCVQKRKLEEEKQFNRQIKLRKQKLLVDQKQCMQISSKSSCFCFK